MKLALVRQRYNPYGGAERFIERAMTALAAEEVELTLLARSWSGGAGAGSDRHIIRYDPFYVGRVWRDWSFARAVRAALKAHAFDLVQSHERIAGCDIFRAGDGVHAAWLEQRARLQRLPGRIATRLSPWHRYTLAAERAMFADPQLKAVICISELVRNDIRRFYGVADQKLHVIYNGIDLERYHPQLALQHRSAVRQRWNIPETTPLFVYVGSGFERKGVSSLLEALAAAGARDARLLVVGNDKQRNRYLSQAARLGLGNRVVFTGGVEDARPYYAAADAFVLPTLYEPLSNAVLEALACGLPCIVSTQCGAAELVKPGVSGYVCDALDLAALSARIDDLARSGMAAGMRPAARAAVAHLGLDAMAVRLLELYASLL